MNGDGRIVVTELIASGAGGGAQVHVQNLVERLPRQRYDVEVISLSDGPAVRRVHATGTPVHVIDGADDFEAFDRVLTLLETRVPDILHNHMFRAEVIGTGAALRLLEMGLPKPFVVSTIHSSRIRSREDQALLRRLTPQMDR